MATRYQISNSNITKGLGQEIDYNNSTKMGSSRSEEGTRQVFKIFRGSSNLYQKYKFLAVNAKSTQIPYVYLPFLQLKLINVGNNNPVILKVEWLASGVLLI
jgi:hypothetical protein